MDALLCHGRGALKSKSNGRRRADCELPLRRALRDHSFQIGGTAFTVSCPTSSRHDAPLAVLHEHAARSLPVSICCLHSVWEAILSLLWPLRWSLVYVPFLPRCMGDCLQVCVACMLVTRFSCFLSLVPPLVRLSPRPTTLACRPPDPAGTDGVRIRRPHKHTGGAASGRGRANAAGASSTHRVHVSHVRKLISYPDPCTGSTPR